LLADPQHRDLAFEMTNAGIQIKVPVTMELDHASSVIVLQGTFTVVDHITAKAAKASSTWSQAGVEPARAIDGDLSTRWGAAENTRSGWLEIDLGKEARIASAKVDEAGFGRIRKFEIQIRQGETWTTIAVGTTIGDQKTIPFDQPVKAQLFRLNILDAVDVPTIAEFQLCE
jgi:hypothetical protein